MCDVYKKEKIPESEVVFDVLYFHRTWLNLNWRVFLILHLSLVGIRIGVRMLNGSEDRYQQHLDALLVTSYQLHLLWFADDWREYGVQSAVLHEPVRRIFCFPASTVERQMVAAIDQWRGLTIEDIRKLEEENRAELKKKIQSAEIALASSLFPSLISRFTAGLE